MSGSSSRSDADVIAQLSTLLTAGHETTAIGLAWSLNWVFAYPDVLARLRSELPPGMDPVAMGQQPYLAAVVDESLRLKPVIIDALRKLRTPMQLGEHLLPANVAIACSMGLAHSNAATFADPGRFDPERFIGRKYGPTEFLPFGGGHRRCLGASLATLEMRVVLGTLLSRGTFEASGARQPTAIRRNVSMAPAGGVPMRRLPHAN